MRIPDTRRLHRTLAGIAALTGVVAFAGGCTSATDMGSNAPVTLRVTNSSCVAGHCDSVDVLAFPTNAPNTPGGLWSIDLGWISTATACLRLPPSANFTVSGPGSTDVTTWTPADSVALGWLPPGGSRFRALPTTATFVATNAAGWNVTLPGNLAIASSACMP